MWELSKEFRFEASHRLWHHDGKCARLHGHSWTFRVAINGLELDGDGPKKGMVTDFADFKKLARPLIMDKLDHHHLNDTLETDSPTSEFVARYIFRYFVSQGFTPVFVQVDETWTSSCRYFGE